MQKTSISKKKLLPMSAFDHGLLILQLDSAAHLLFWNRAGNYSKKGHMNRNPKNHQFQKRKCSRFRLSITA